MRDWPLALCDPRTVGSDDLEAADLVYHDYVVENRQVYRQPGQNWYYIRDQQPNEAWIFRQSDSKPGVGIGMLQAYHVDVDDCSYLDQAYHTLRSRIRLQVQMCHQGRVLRFEHLCIMVVTSSYISFSWYVALPFNAEHPQCKGIVVQ